MLAATTCSSVASPAARREKRLRPRQDGVDPRVAAVAGRLDGDPVADRGKIRAARGLVPQPARRPAPATLSAPVITR